MHERGVCTHKDGQTTPGRVVTARPNTAQPSGKSVPGTPSKPSPGQGKGTPISPPGVPGPGSLQSLKFPPMPYRVPPSAQSSPRTPLML